MLSQEAARFALMPTLRTNLGVTGHRPLVDNLDCHEVINLFGPLSLVTGRLTTRLVDRPHTPKPTWSKQRYLQEAFARHLRDIARAFPAA